MYFRTNTIYMWSKEVKLITSASKEQIWELWTDVTNWKVWDDQVIESMLYGKFEQSQKGELQPKSGPKSNFELVEVTRLKSFTSRSQLPFTTMDFIHSMHAAEGVLTVVHKVEMRGAFTFLFSRVIGNKLIKELPKALKKLEGLAKEIRYE